MEGRRIGGEGLEHEQKYIRERIEQAGDTDEYAEAAEVLEEEVRDLEVLEDRVEAGGAQPGNLEELREEANLPGDRSATRQGADLDALQGSQVDLEQQPPDAEARARLTDRLEGGPGGSSPGR